MKTSNIVQIILLIIFIGATYYLVTLSKSEALYVKSNLDNKEYLVQNLEDKEEATYILSIIYHRIFILKDYLTKNINNYPQYAPYIKQFSEKINNLTLLENSPNGKYTSYTVNKGEEIALCLRSKNTGKLHDINLIMYVTLHELAHVACPELDHTELFKEIFIFFLKISIILNIYKKVDYQYYPHEYCGLNINENLLKY